MLRDARLTVTKDGRRGKSTTKDLRLCGKDGQGSHPFKNTPVDGWYCRFCLCVVISSPILGLTLVFRKQKGSKNAAFLTGNVTTRRRHLLRCGDFCIESFLLPNIVARSHLDEYWSLCTDSGITPIPPKDWVAPRNWVPPNERDDDPYVCKCSFLIIY
jgi:hypothetical protein